MGPSGRKTLPEVRNTKTIARRKDDTKKRVSGGKKKLRTHTRLLANTLEFSGVWPRSSTPTKRARSGTTAGQQVEAGVKRLRAEMQTDGARLGRTKVSGRAAIAAQPGARVRLFIRRSCSVADKDSWRTPSS